MATVDDFDQALEQYHLAAAEFIKGNPEPYKRVFSRREERDPRQPLWPSRARVGAGR